MRKILLAALAALSLSACASSIQSAYDDHARRECDQEASGAARSACYDRVDQNRRDHQ
ncbi:MAG TPA: lipoprotein [Caulobacterales bacterium]|nr:lipoprotein [Caulobacterales bacterium]